MKRDSHVPLKTFGPEGAAFLLPGQSPSQPFGRKGAWSRCDPARARGIRVWLRATPMAPDNHFVAP